MKRSTLIKRINKQIKLNNATSIVAIKTLFGIANQEYGRYFNGKDIIRPCGYYGRFARHKSKYNYMYAICDLLDLCRVKYVKGNDAPRGGYEGNYIKLITKIEKG